MGRDGRHMRRHVAVLVFLELVLVLPLLGGDSSPFPSTASLSPAAQRAWDVLLMADPRLGGILDPSNTVATSLVLAAHGNPEALLTALERQHAATAVPASDLWNQQRSQGDQEAIDLWISAHAIEFPGLGYPSWTVPVAPTWHEDPFANVSWLTRYQALGWLMAVAGAYRETGERRYLDELVGYVMSWIASEGDPQHASKRAWYDHAAALRAEMLVFLLNTDLADVLPGDEYETVLLSLATHAHFLDTLLDKPAFRGHNHRLFHALALYNLAEVFPEFRGSGAWLHHATAKLSQLVDDMVSPDGVELEQAASYHYLAMTVFEDAADYLRPHDPTLARKFDERIALMTTFGAVIISPFGTVPALGDTDYGASGGPSVIRDAVQRGFGSEMARFIVSHGSTGTRPPDQLVFPDGGYVVMRPSYGDLGPWTDDLQVVMDVGPARRIHGHEDGLSFVVNAAGAPLIIDPGGPYLYGAASQRALFADAEAHNSVVVGGEGQQLGPVEHVRTTDTSQFSVVDGETTSDAGYTHRRILVLLKPSTVIVIDRFIGAAASQPAVLRYHLAPEAAAVTDGASVGVREGTASMRVFVYGEHPVMTQIVKGGTGPGSGWVTPAYDRKVEAPVVTSRQAEPGWFVSVISTAQSHDGGVTDATVQRNGTSFLIHLVFGGTTAAVDLAVGDDGVVSVT